MAEYTVTVRDDADIQALAAWASEEFREPTTQLNYEIRELLRKHSKAATATPRAVQRRGPRSQAA